MLAELYAVRAQEHPPVSLGAGSSVYSLPVRQGIDWMVREYTMAYPLKELFQAVGYSRSYYTRLFCKETGLSPLAWMNQYRIEQAKRLLAHSDKSISDIARAVGIPDPNYFARLFRSLAGTSAMKFRQKPIERTPPRIGRRSGIPA